MPWWVDMMEMGPGEHGKGDEGSPAFPQLHPDRDPGNPALHSRFVELSEAYQVLSREHSRRSYDHQLRSGVPPKPPGAAAHPKSAHQAHRYNVLQFASSPPHLLGSLIPTRSLFLLPSSSWEPPNAHYWAQFRGVRPESRRQQYRHNQRVLGYCLLIMLAGMGLHYVAFRCLPAFPGAVGRGQEGERSPGWPGSHAPHSVSLLPLRTFSLAKAALH